MGLATQQLAAHRYVNDDSMVQKYNFCLLYDYNCRSLESQKGSYSWRGDTDEAKWVGIGEDNGY